MLHDKFEACLLSGAIGDAWGSSLENILVAKETSTFYLGGRPAPPQHWTITDDTQLTLATCEALAAGPFSPEILAEKFLEYYRQKKLTGLGASTLKAIQEREAGIHWTQVGHQRHYAAGNGAAMRIAPFAFYSTTTRQTIYDACRITHQNDDAYAGALAVYLSIRAAISCTWNGRNNLIDIILPELPDTVVKDRLLEINSYPKNTSITQIALLGNNGYVVNSIPFAIYCADKALDLGLANMFQHIVTSGGDTDTNASIAGQIAGALIGAEGLPSDLLSKLKLLPEYSWIKDVIETTKVTLL